MACRRVDGENFEWWVQQVSELEYSERIGNENAKPMN
jgi:hypothetical protein